MDKTAKGTTRNHKQLIWILAIAINTLIIASFLMPAAFKKGHLLFLPLLNAILNSLTFISLVMALIAIKLKSISWHRKFIFSAFASTLIFLASYLIYHFSTPSTTFGGVGPVRYLYYFLLLTHVMLAIVVVPLALIAIGRGINMEVERHKKIVRWAMPVWLYVSATGVIVYWLIAPYYHH